MKFKVEPWQHQKDALERAFGRNSYALFFEMGTGKTKTAIEILRADFNGRRKHLKTLVLCPPVVIGNWKREFAIHSNIEPRRIVCLGGPGKKRLKDFHNRISKSPDSIFITNYQSLQMSPLFDALRKWGPEFIVFDEAHKLKSHQSKTSKLADQLANPRDPRTRKSLPQPFKLLLTGTPILNSMMDIFMPYKIMDGGETFGSNYYAFRNRYFYDANAGMPRQKHFPKFLPRPGCEAALNKLLAESSMRVTKEECLDLPPLVRKTYRVGMTKEQAKAYREMKRDFITYLEDNKDKAVMADLAITKGLRLMQITSGFVNIEEGKTHGFNGSPKLELLEELLRSITPDHKVIIWCAWKHNYGDIRDLCGRIGVESVEVHGGVSSKQKHENIDRFNDDPKCRVFIGHPGSGGIGVNLVVAPYAIFYSRNFSLEQSLQAEARNHRGGSSIHERITRIDLVCENTIDELICNRLGQKKAISEKVLGDVAREMKEQEI